MNFQRGHIPPFVYWWTNAFPTVFSPELSQLEILQKVIALLNNVIEQSNGTVDEVERLEGVVTSMQEYMDAYFDNLDVQEEIDNKLDAMVESGELDSIIRSIIEPYIQQIEVYVTPEMFGAVGDGVNDDTEAFQAAVSSGAKQIFLKGTYKLTNIVNIGSSMSVIGGTLYSPSSSYKRAMLNVSSCDYLEIAYTTFTTDRDNTHVIPPEGHTRPENSLSSNITFIRASNVEKVYIHDVTFTNSEYDTGFYECDNVYVNNFNSTNASMVSYAEKNNNLVFENGSSTLYQLLSNGDHHYYITAGNKFVRIENTKMYSNVPNGVYPIHLYASNEQVEGLGEIETALIRNCYIEADTLIASSCSKSCTVEDCSFKKISTTNALVYCNGTAGINFINTIFDSSVQLTFTNMIAGACTCDNCTFSSRIGFANNNNNDVIFRNCSLKGATGTGDGLWNAYFYDCTFVAPSYAIYTSHVSPTKYELYNCILKANADGVFSVNSNGTIKLIQCYGENENANKKLNYNGSNTPTVYMYNCCFPDLTIRTEAGTIWYEKNNTFAD